MSIIDLGQLKSNQSGPFVQITPENFEADLVRRSQQVPVVLQLGSSRSPQSEQLKADLGTLAQQANEAWVFAYTDVDTHPEVAQVFGVQGVPTVIALSNGQPIANFQGGQPMEALQQWTAAVVQATATQQPQEDPRFAPATEALNNGDFDAAIAVYEEILAAEPKNQEAKMARDNAKLLSRLSKQDRSQDPIALADASPADIDKAFAAADAEIAGGNAKAAFDRLITLLKATVGEEKKQVHARLLELFALFEPADPVALAARQEMASALF